MECPAIAAATMTISTKFMLSAATTPAGVLGLLQMKRQQQRWHVVFWHVLF
jgi:hypothetical protein